MNYVIGIDIGGTNFRIGTVTEDGKLMNFERKSSRSLVSDDAVERIGKEIKDYVLRYGLEGNIKAVAIGVPSIVSKDKSFVYSTPNLKGIENIDLGNLLSKYLDLPVFIDRDVNYLLLNDIQYYKLDADRDKTILGFYVGTGFGNAIYINGNIYSGKNGVAGELGHIPMYGVKERCTCGNIGCAETVCSGLFLEKIKKEHFPDTIIDDVFEKHSSEAVVQEFIRTISIIVATEINILDPDHVILAGGVISMKGFPKDFLVAEIKKCLRKPYPEKNVNIIFTELTQESGVLGSAAYVFNKKQNK
ncbi:MAG TPA: allose kinase [Clostridium sp.]|nr:allose kinase [Clostridia bacterium]HCW05187.1 allose kinase [Clostridium sp.]